MEVALKLVINVADNGAETGQKHVTLTRLGNTVPLKSHYILKSKARNEK